MKKLLLVLGLFSLILPLNALADGCAPGEPCWEDFKPKAKPAPVVAPDPEPVAEAEMPEEEMAPVVAKESSGLDVLISGGANLMFFNCESTKIGPALYVDLKHNETSLNLRAGVEGYDLEDSEQYKHTPESTYFQQEPDFTLIRLPLSLEYSIGLGEKTEILVGGGPDLLLLSGEDNDATVGFHLGARIRQAITENLGASIGAGYLWGEADLDGDTKYDLDSAFVGADLSIRF